MSTVQHCGLWVNVKRKEEIKIMSLRLIPIWSLSKKMNNQIFDSVDCGIKDFHYNLSRYKII